MARSEHEIPVGTLISRIPTAVPPLVTEIAQTAVRQYAVGLLVQPEAVECTEVLLLVRPGLSVVADRVPNEVMYRVIYQVAMPAIGRQFWMVVLGTYEPFDGVIDGTCSWSRAAFYVYGEFGWEHHHDYEHRWCALRAVDPGAHEGAFPDPLDSTYSNLTF
jgi:hypothetical protein